MSEQEYSEHPGPRGEYELLEHAMTLWLWGQWAVERLPWMEGEHLAQYERAIAAGVEELRRYATMGELVTAYYAGDGHHEDGTVEPAGVWAERICRRVGADTSVSWSIVEDASYFRRSRELIIAATEENS